jgi:orotidine-5'-phosphate decarboxylase
VRSARARGDVRAAMSDGFGDRLAARVSARESQLVLGLDPDPARLWPSAGTGGGGAGAEPAPPETPAASGAARAPAAPADPRAAPADARGRAATAVRAHCERVLEATAEECVAVKLQLACFERLGPEGWACLEEVVALADAHGLLVIADAKRGDIDVSARAYAQAFLGETASPFGTIPGLGADALTVNPLLGRDSLAPFVETARHHGRGIFALVRTSNPGAAEVQELDLAAGGNVSLRLAELVAALGRPGVGRSGLSDVGAVVGATVPAALDALRAAMPAAVLLLPGVGAQGGRLDDLAPAFAAGVASALVTVSRGIVNAYQASGGDPASAARRQAARLREQAWQVSQATA